MAFSFVLEENGVDEFTLEVEAGVLLLEEFVIGRRGQVSWAELEVPLGIRRARVSWAELEVPEATRRARMSWAELEVPNAPRRGQVSWAELRVLNAPTSNFYILQEDDEQGRIANEPNDGFLLQEETVGIPTRRGQVSWAELETPLAPRRAQVSWAELETPTPSAGFYILAEHLTLGLPTYLQQEDAGGRYLLEEDTGTRRGRIAFAEFETPTAPARARVSWAEFQVPDIPATTNYILQEENPVSRIAKEPNDGFLIKEEDLGTRRAQMSWAEFQVDNAPRRAHVSWAELEVPIAPRRAQVSWVELEVPILQRRAQVSWAELGVPALNTRRAQVSWAEFAVGVVPSTSIRESFTAGMGTILGVQAKIQDGIYVLEIVDMHIDQVNTGPKRAGRVLLNIDDVLYFVEFEFTEETFDQRTQEGYTKVRNPKARSR